MGTKPVEACLFLNLQRQLGLLLKPLVLETLSIHFCSGNSL